MKHSSAKRKKNMSSPPGGDRNVHHQASWCWNIQVEEVELVTQSTGTLMGVLGEVYIHLCVCCCSVSPEWTVLQLGIHSGKQQLQEAITSPLQLCVGVCVTMLEFICPSMVDGCVCVCVCVCACVCVCVPPLPVRHSWICHLETELPIYSLHFSGSLTSVTEGRRAKEAWMCCERGRERVFVLKPTAASVRLRLSLWCSAVHSRESANVCVLTQSASFLRFSWKHSCTQTHSCCSGLWTDVLRESREFPSWVN